MLSFLQSMVVCKDLLSTNEYIAMIRDRVRGHLRRLAKSAGLVRSFIDDISGCVVLWETILV